jgi:hypothetical protein
MGPRGPSPGQRGGYMGPSPPRGGRGGMMPPRGPPAGYAAAPTSFDAYGRPLSPPRNDPYSYGSSPGPMRQPSPGPIGMAVSPETVGQAIEMQPQSRRYDAPEPSQRVSGGPHALSVDGQHAPLESPTSMYSRPDSYIPPRSGWNANDRQTLSPRPDGSPQPAGHTGTNYYEDVDPRFARRPSPQNDAPVPSSLMPGGPHCKYFID